MTVDLHFETHGDPAAPPVLLLGSLGSDLHMWDPQIHALSSRHHVIAVDHRGHGGSPAPSGPYTMADLGYRFRYYLFHGQEHYGPPAVDQWAEGANWLHTFVRNPNPAQVTFVRSMPFENAIERVNAPASGPVELGDRSVLRLTLRVTSIGADAQLAMRLETAETRDGPWRPAGEFSKHTSPARERAAFGGLDRWVRAVAEVTGAVTFGLAGEAA